MALETPDNYQEEQDKSFKIVKVSNRSPGAQETFFVRYIGKDEDGKRVLGNTSIALKFSNVGIGIKYSTAPTLVLGAQNFGFNASWDVPTSSAYPNYSSTEIFFTKDLPNFGINDLNNAAVQKVVTSSNYFSVTTGLDLSKRYVRIRHVGYQNGAYIYSPLSSVQEVTPRNPADEFNDTVPPNEVSIVSAGWDGDDVVISFTLPSTEKPTRFIVQLTNSGNTRYFHRRPNGTSSNQTVRISQDEQYLAFGSYPTSYSGIFQGADASDNLSTGTSFTVSAKSNPIASVTPTFVLTGITNGYTATWVLPDNADFAKVYERGTTWGATDPQESELVYSGQSPAIIKKTVYTQRFIKIRYITKDGFNSQWSSEQTVTPIDSISADITAPNAPTWSTTGNSAGLENTGPIGFNGFLNLSWNAVSDSTLRGYRIRFRPVTTPASNYSYVDSPGAGTAYRLTGLAAGTTYEVGIASYDEFNNVSSSYTTLSPNLQVAGVPFINTNVTTTGYFGASAGGEIGEFRFGYNVVSGRRGIRFNDDNYWYIDSNAGATFKLGGNASNFIQWDGGTFAIQGNIRALGGYFGGNLELRSGASVWSGPLNSSGSLNGDGFLLSTNGLAVRKTVNVPVSYTITAASWTPNIVTYTSTNTFSTGQVVSVTGSSNPAYNITGTIINRTLTTFQLSLAVNPGLFSGSATATVTNVVTRNVRLDSTDGGIYAEFGSIAGWTIDSEKIERLSSSKYSGISSSGSYAFYAGANQSGNFSGDDQAAFWVKPTGEVRATNISITGGNLTIGSNFSVNSSGVLEATGAIINGTIRATGGYIGGTTTGWLIGSGSMSNSSSYVDYLGTPQTLSTVLGSNAQITLTSSSAPNVILNDVGFADTLLNVLNASARTTVGAGQLEISGRTAPAIFGTMPSQLLMWTSVGSSDINFKWQGGRSVSIRKIASGSTGSLNITVNNTTGLSNGMFVAGSGIAVGTTISIVSSTQLSLNYPVTQSFTNEEIAFSGSEISPSKIRWWNYIAGNGQRTANLWPNRDSNASNTGSGAGSQIYRPLVVDTDGRQYLGPIFFFSTAQASAPGTGVGEDGDLYFSTA